MKPDLQLAMIWSQMVLFASARQALQEVRSDRDEIVLKDKFLWQEIG